MLLPFQGVLFLCIPTQGVATLYPGLSAACPFRASFAACITNYNVQNSSNSRYSFFIFIFFFPPSIYKPFTLFDGSFLPLRS